MSIKMELLKMGSVGEDIKWAVNAVRCFPAWITAHTFSIYIFFKMFICIPLLLWAFSAFILSFSPGKFIFIL